MTILLKILLPKVRYYMPDRRKIAQEWFDKGNHDFTTAKLAFNAGGLADTTLVLLQQAVEKHLKGYLISKGWHLKKTHNLVELTDTAKEYNTVFNEYITLARKLTALFLEERYPSGPPTDYPKKELAQFAEQTEKLIKLIKKETK